jgi:hypothetical protein
LNCLEDLEYQRQGPNPDLVELFGAESDDGVDFGGAVGGEPGGYEGDEGDAKSGGQESKGIGGAEPEELRLEVRVAASAAGMPRAILMASSRSDSLRTIQSTPLDCAPRAMRMPISLMRRTTL